MMNIFMACAAWRPDMELPEGMIATRQPLRGERIPTRSGRAYGSSVVVATWPKDNLHSARTPKLCFILTGPIAFQVNNYVLHCQPRHGILLPAGTPFSNGRNGFLDQDNQHRGTYEMLQMMPYRGGLVCWLSRGQQDTQGKIHKTETTCSIPDSKVSFYLNQLSDEAIKKDLHQRFVCNSLLGMVIALLHRELQQLPTLRSGEIDVMEGWPPVRQKGYSIAQAQEYMKNNLREPLSIERVARYVCMSRTVFIAQFRAKTGKSFSQYLQDLRFTQAQKLLKETDLTVRHISAAVGFKPHRMRVLFRERENMPPLEFRRLNRPKNK